MPLTQDEGFTLRTTPFREADLIVSFFTRDHGKLRGVARGARRLKSRFGAALEPMSRSRIIFFEKEGRDLVTLDHADLLLSLHERAGGELEVSWTLQYIVEVVDSATIEGSAEPLLYRLLVAVTDGLASGVSPKIAARYFELWILKLHGVLPDLGSCGICGGRIQGAAGVMGGGEGLVCSSCFREEDRRGRRVGRKALGWLREAQRAKVTELAPGGRTDAPPTEVGEFLHSILVRYLGREVRTLMLLSHLEAMP
jgi:DNA repair protein RecO (recombination protein O)